MARGDRRRSLKMKRQIGKRKHKARMKRRREQSRGRGQTRRQASS